MNCFRGILYLLLLIAPSLAYPQLTSDSLLMLDWYKQAVDFKHQRQYDSAWQYFERVHRIAKQEDWWLHYYKAEKQFARLLRDWQAQPFAAVEKLDSLIPQAAAHLGPQEVETGELYEARANTYNQLGQYSLALQDYVQSLHIRRLNFGELHQRVAASYLNLAPLFLRNQQARKAIRYADLASAILQQDERYPPHFMLNALIWQGRAYDQLGDQETGEKYLLQAVDFIQQKEIFHYRHVHSLYLYQAELYLHWDKLSKADEYLQKAAQYAAQYLDPQDPLRINHLSLQSSIAQARGEFEQAKQANLVQLEQYRAMPGYQYRQIGQVLNRMGRIALEQGQWKESREYFRQSMSHNCPDYKGVATEPFPVPGTIHYSISRMISLYYNLALSYHEEAKTRNNPEVYRKAAEILQLAIEWMDASRASLAEPEERTELTSYRFRVYELAMENAWRLQQLSPEKSHLDLAFGLAERSRANLLWESIQDQSLHNPTAITQSIQQKQTKIESKIRLARTQWFRLWQEDPESPELKQYQLNISRLQLSQDSLIEHLREENPHYHRLKYRYEFPSLASLQTQLQEGSLLLEYFETDSLFYLLAIRRNTTTFHRIERDEAFREAADQWIKQLQQASQNSPQSLSALGHMLFRRLVPAALLTDKTSEVIIVADGSLNALPMDLLCLRDVEAVDYANLDYWFQHYPIRYAYAAWTLYESVSREKPGEFWAGFAPSYGPASPNDLLAKRSPQDGLGNLSGAQNEVRQIADQVDGAPFLGSQASKAAFLAKASNYQVLHLALHAYFLEEQPMFSGLIFGSEDSHDTLLLHEIYPLGLSTELAVLSACNTGVGQIKKGEGALSLAHAFAYAGCPSVLMSLWPVDDQSTQQLMRGFYQGLGDGLNKSEALRQARQAYLAQHDLSHPYYWGAFVMIGDDQSLQLPFSFWNWWWLLPLIGGLLIFWKTQFRQS